MIRLPLSSQYHLSTIIVAIVVIVFVFGDEYKNIYIDFCCC